jgi:hypothetical protein
MRSIRAVERTVYWFLLLATQMARAEVGPPPGFDPAKIVWGSETNGVRAGAQVWGEAGTTVIVLVAVPASNHVSPAPPNAPTTHRWRGDYFRPTNVPPFEVQLTSSDGKTIQKGAKGASPAGFPQLVSLMGVERANTPHTGVGFYSGPPLPPIPIGSRGLLGSLELTNYFMLGTNVDLRLTVWPKIYKRRFEWADQCDRVDIPPVTIVLKPAQARPDQK